MKQRNGWIIAGMVVLMVLLSFAVVYIQWLSPRPDYMGALGIKFQLPTDIALEYPAGKTIEIQPKWAEHISRKLYKSEVDPLLIQGVSRTDKEPGCHYNQIEYFIPSRSTRWFDFKKFKFSYKYTEEDKNYNQMTHRNFEKLLEKNPEIYGIKRMP